MKKLIFGKGVYVTGKYKATYRDSDGVQHNTKEYNKWYDMLRRCYSRNRDKHASYMDCEVSENFLDFQFFAEWCNHQVGFDLEDCQLDKDILGCGKLYSEDNCCFVPRKINMLLASSRIDKELPIGVSIDRHGNFVARLKVNNKKVHISQHSTVEKAGKAYKIAKENYLKVMARDFKDVLSEKVFHVLISYDIKNCKELFEDSYE